MQRRQWPRRALALVLALWYTVAFTGVTAMHRCPQHDGPAPTRVDAAMPMPMPAGGGASSASMPRAHHSHEAPAGKSHGTQCTCFGQCCTAHSALVPVPVDAVVAAITRVPAPVPAVAATVVAATQLRLPFANGPPHALGA